MFQNKVNRFVGTDVAPTMIAEANRLNPPGYFLTCEAHKIPFPNKTFDRLVCYSVFHYLSDLKTAARVLNEFHRVVKESGLIFIGDVLELPPKSAVPSNKKLKPWWPESLNHHLTKLRIVPNFFKKYCKKNKLKCEILKQAIPGRILPDKRYDVRITVL